MASSASYFDPFVLELLPRSDIVLLARVLICASKRCDDGGNRKDRRMVPASKDLLHGTADKGTSKFDYKCTDCGQPTCPEFIIFNCVEMALDAPNWFYAAGNFIGFVLCMIPLPWHLEAWNTGTCLYMIWTGALCLIYFINAIVWNSDAINKAPVWCDISTKILVGSLVAIPAAALCITRRLYQIASIQSVAKTRAQKRRDIMIDLAIGVGLPVLVMILHIVVQAHRFIIYEEIGCVPFYWHTWLALPLVHLWPLILGLVSAYYGIRTIRELAIRRAQFKEFLSTNGQLNSSRYLRLMGLAGTAVFFTIPLSCLNIAIIVNSGPFQPYVSWSFAHNDFGLVFEFPSVVWQQDAASVGALELPRIFSILCAIVFFAFFGFADEARKNYRLAYMSVAKRVGLSAGSMSTTGTWSANGTNTDSAYNSQSNTMPIYITHEAEKKHDSMGSFELPDYGGALVDLKDPFSPMGTMSGSMSRESFPRSPVDFDDVPLPRLPEASLNTSAPPRYPHSVPDL